MAYTSNKQGKARRHNPPLNQQGYRGDNRRRGVGYWPISCGGTLQKGGTCNGLVDSQTILAKEISGGLRSNGTEGKIYKVDVISLRYKGW
jgi:hypothetical protein